ncbi:MAG: type II secretion system protein GspG [Rhodospirillales bacterium]|nr:type II secretion system protein GspG [Rhodospirillales bacterium]
MTLHSERTDRRRRAAGFTLIELLVVLVILGLLVGIVVPRAIGYLSKAKSDVAKIQLENLATSLDLFRLDVGRYPNQDEGLQALVARPSGIVTWRGPYLKASSVPLDPWERAYVYEIPGKRGGPYELLSFGADGTRGGEGENADITAK